MTLQQIKDAVDSGKKVHWVNGLYTVIKQRCGDYLISCPTGSSIGLVWADGVTMNCNSEDEFYIEGEVENDFRKSIEKT